MIVQVAAIRSGLTEPFTSYAILGDDVVIHHDDVASQYCKILQYLGVSISFNKSLVSKEYAEFAKRIKSTRGDFTPIGPGLLLQASRHKASIGAFAAECVRLGYFVFPNAVLSLTRSLPKSINSKSGILLILQVCFGITGVLCSPSRPISSMGTVRCLQGDDGPSTTLRNQYFNVFLTLRS